VESNFHDFPLPMIGDMPKVETVLVPPAVLGRPRRAGDPAFRGAVLNAVFAATGKRVRSLPLKPGDLKRPDAAATAG